MSVIKYTIPCTYPTTTNLSDAITLRNMLNSKHHIFFSMSSSKRYVILPNIQSCKNINPRMCLCEMVLDNTSRPFIDFDCDIENSIYSIENIIRDYIKNTYNLECRISWLWSFKVSMKWHCIISGVYFKSCMSQECRKMLRYLSSCIDDLVADDSVYRSNTSFRCVGQYKHQDNNYVKILYPVQPFNYRDLFITPTKDDIEIAVPIDNNKPDILYSRHVTEKGMFIIPDGYVAGKKYVDRSGKVNIHLKRYKPSFCNICKRVHHSQNANMRIVGKHVELICYRDLNIDGSIRSKLVYNI